jgi:hypothetical protein
LQSFGHVTEVNDTDFYFDVGDSCIYNLYEHRGGHFVSYGVVQTRYTDGLDKHPMYVIADAVTGKIWFGHSSSVIESRWRTGDTLTRKEDGEKLHITLITVERDDGCYEYVYYTEVRTVERVRAHELEDLIQ